MNAVRHPRAEEQALAISISVWNRSSFLMSKFILQSVLSDDSVHRNMLVRSDKLRIQGSYLILAGDKL